MHTAGLEKACSREHGERADDLTTQRLPAEQLGKVTRSTETAEELEMEVSKWKNVKNHL